MPGASARQRWLSWGPLLMAAGVASWLWPAPAHDLQPLMAAARSDATRTATALVARSSEIADAPRTRAILATDADTAADLSDEEVGISLRPGERVALFQRIDGAAATLILALPRAAPASRHKARAADPSGVEARDGSDPGGSDAARLVASASAPGAPQVQATEQGRTPGSSRPDAPAPTADDPMPAEAPTEHRSSRRGADTFAAPLAAAGLQLMAANEEPHLCQVTRAEPAQPRPGLEAFVTVCAPLVMRDAQHWLQAHSASAAIVVTGRRLSIAQAAASPPTARALQVSLPGLTLSLEVQLPRPRKPLPLVAAGFLLAVLGALLTLWPQLQRRRKPRVSAAPVGTRALEPAPQRAASSLPPPLPPRLGRYELLRQLGAGSMGEVHLARMHGEAGFERTVALKVVASAPDVQDLLLAHFLDEARLAARIHHPNVVDVLALEKLEGRYVIAMELVDGADLATLIGAARKTGERVPLGVALRILSQVCAGVHAAHSARAADGSSLELIHRDIKSANILVSRAGAVKVGDFGVARAAQQHMLRATHNDTVKGTVGYMAPEQQLRQALDARSDQYAIGAVAYELLSGRLVDLDVRRLLPRGTGSWPHLPPLPGLRDDVSPQLWGVILRALAYDKEARYPDCAALQEALEAEATHVPGTTDRAVGQWVEQLLARSSTTRVSG